MNRRAQSYAALALFFCACSATRVHEPVREHYFTTSDQVRLRYLAAGSGPPVILVPGWALPADVFLPQLQSPGGARVIALDPRAQGWSEAPRDGHHPERRAEDIRELLTVVGAVDPVLVGWSLGVADVIAFTQRFPGLARGIILVDGLIVNSKAPERLEGVIRNLHLFQNERPAFAERFVASLFATEQPAEYQHRLREAVMRAPADANIAVAVNTMTRDWRGALTEFKQPLVYMITAPLASQEPLLKTVVPHAQVIKVNSGHAILADNPELFLAALRTIIDRSKNVQE